MVERTYNDASHLFGGTEEPAGINQKLLVMARKTSRDQLAILLAENGDDYNRGKMVGRHFGAVEDHPDLPTLSPDDLHFRDVDHLFDLVVDLGRNSSEREMVIAI